MRSKKLLYTFLIPGILLLTYSVYGQQSELRKLCTDYDKLLKGSSAFHLPYILKVASAKDTTTERLQVDLYKSGDKDYLKMGRMQEVIHDGSLLMVVNHQAKMIRVGVDSINKGSNHLLVSTFESIIDSSKTIQSTVKNGIVHYVLTFSPTYIYSRVELDFSKKTKNLYRVEAVFSDVSRSEFRYLVVEYQDPDFKWIPGPHFPDTYKYIVKSNTGKYITQDAYDSYKLF